MRLHIAAAALATLVAAAAPPVRIRSVANFGPKTAGVSLNGVSFNAAAKSPAVSFQDAALDALAVAANIDRSSLRISSAFPSSDRLFHVHAIQTFNGLAIANAVGSVHFDAASLRIISINHNFVPEQTFQAALAARSAKSTPGSSAPIGMLNVDPEAQIADDAGSILTRTAATNSDASAVRDDLDSAALSPVDAAVAAATYLQLGDENALRSISAELVPDTLAFASPGTDADSGRNAYVIHGIPRAIDTVPSRLAYLQDNNGRDLVPVWDIVLDLGANWFHIHVDANSGRVIGLLDWINGASFTVYPLGINDPASGHRVHLVDPEHPVASPYGWLSRTSRRNTTTYYNTTMGNNVFAQENLDGGFEWLKNYRPSGGSKHVFDFPANLTKQPSTYVDASITNLFYYNNIIHDLFYVYGFDEVAGNFQENNYGRGGKGGDGVIANAQDGSGYNNANFATPPDGTRPRMRMYVWTSSSPYRDGDLEGGIIIHEYAHGISIRLTGGPENVGCLGWGESGGMGEGWGDFFATTLRTTSNTTHDAVFPMGSYANGGEGIRKFPYSTSMGVNPSTYAFITKPGYWGVHAKGEVWAEILYEVFWALVDHRGFDPDWFNVEANSTKTSSATSSGKGGNGPLSHLSGNKLALHLVVDGLKLQPCYPSFVDARDAILLADQVGTDGVNQCVLWTAFAKRGLGVNATAGGEEDFSLPEECGDSGVSISHGGKVGKKMPDEVEQMHETGGVRGSGVDATEQGEIFGRVFDRIASKATKEQVNRPYKEKIYRNANKRIRKRYLA